jgi:demethylmenaquinone methyltransferase/2-methoxy-6-polyprenyl-1,4-benzoquinol methylase
MERVGGVCGWAGEVLEARTGVADAVRKFSWLAPFYEVWAHHVEARPRRRVLELAGVQDGESVLEVATGTGVQLVALARSNPSGRTCGVELAPGMLKRTRKRLARERLGNVELHEGDARRLPLGDASFDVVTNEYMLNLFPRAEIPAVLAEYKRVLRPGGRLVVSNMTKGALPHHQVWDALYARGIDLFVNCRGVLAAPALEDLGFTYITREYMAPALFPTEIVTARAPT